MTALCVGRDPAWWSPGHEQSRLAVMICRRCSGCPSTDPEPVGVILRGVAYSDTGAVLPECACGRPCDGYRGGDVRCRSCAEPNLGLLNVRAARDSWLNKLHERGMSDRQIGFEAGMAPRAVEGARRQHRKRRGTAGARLGWLDSGAVVRRTTNKEA